MNGTSRVYVFVPKKIFLYFLVTFIVVIHLSSPQFGLNSHKSFRATIFFKHCRQNNFNGCLITSSQWAYSLACLIF